MSSMSQKNYIQFAAMLRRVRGLPVCTNKNSGAAGRAAVSIMEMELISILLDDNHKFDPDRFRKAAYRSIEL